MNNQAEILAINLRTGRPVWGRETAVVYRDPFDETVHRFYNPPNTLGLARFTMTVCGGRLYARMGSAASGGPQEPQATAASGYLVALDLKAEGRLAFKISPEEGWSFEGSPVADASGVYVAARQSDVRPRRYVACYDAETGQQRWRQFVCGSDTPAQPTP